MEKERPLKDSREFKWYGKHSSELTREELLEVIAYLRRDIDHEREMHDTSLALLTLRP